MSLDVAVDELARLGTLRDGARGVDEAVGDDGLVEDGHGLRGLGGEDGSSRHDEN
jgi:hypothetical protein